MYCSRCGKELPDGATFCPGCGAEISAPLPERSRPILVTILAILNFVGAAMQVVIGLAFALVSLTPEPPRDTRFLLALSGFALLAIAALSITCGYGLLKLRPYGRIIQLVYSWIGLIGFPLGTIIHALILIYLYRPGVKVLFSGTPVEQLRPEEVEQLRALRSSSAMGVAIAVVAVLAIAVAFVGIVAAIAVPNFLNAVDRGKQKRTMSDIRAIGAAIEAYAVDNDAYPACADIEGLASVLQPTYIRDLPRRDAWGNAMLYEPSGGKGYAVGSGGKDGGALTRVGVGGVTTDFNDAIVFSDGKFVQWPDGRQR